MLLLSESNSIKIWTSNLYFMQFCRWENWEVGSEMSWGKLQRKSIRGIRQLNYFICTRCWIGEMSILSLMLISVALAFVHNLFRDVTGITLNRYWCNLEWYFGIGWEFSLICSLPIMSIISRKAISETRSYWRGPSGGHKDDEVFWGETGPV